MKRNSLDQQKWWRNLHATPSYSVTEWSALHEWIPLVKELSEFLNACNLTHCHREKEKDFYHKPNRGCCSGCAHQFGFYHEDDILSAEEAEFLSTLWSEEDGFWSPTGCKIPRRLRSWTCVGYSCKNLGETKLYWSLIRFTQDVVTYNLKAGTKDLLYLGFTAGLEKLVPKLEGKIPTSTYKKAKRILAQARRQNKKSYSPDER